MLYQFVQAAFWLALSTWFGGTLFITLAASAIFRTLKDQNPILPQVLAVNLEGQHGTLLGSNIMSALFASLAKIQLLCAIVTLLALASHFFLTDTTGQNLYAAILRLTLALLAIGTTAYDRFIIHPRLTKHRQDYLDHADEPDLANPAKEAFDKDQQATLTTLLILTSLLAGLIFFAAPITPSLHATPISQKQ